MASRIRISSSGGRIPGLLQDLDLIPLAIQCDGAIFGGTTERNGNGSHVNVDLCSDLELALIHFAVDDDNSGINMNARQKELLTSKRTLLARSLQSLTAM